MADLNDQTQNVNLWDDAKSKAVTIITDGANERLAVDSKVTNGSGANAVNIQDGGNSITVDGTVELGATTLAALESITVQNPGGASAVNIQDGGNSITIDAVSLPLPTGASTAANQTTANTSLASIDGKLNSLGQKTAAGSVPVVIASDQPLLSISNTRVISTGNSSTANLNAAASFTGTGVDALAYATLDVSFFASQPCTIDIQQSTNNTNWDTIDSYTVAASTGSGRTFKIISQYIRVVVTNTGGSATTALRLQTILATIDSVLPRNLIRDINGQQRLPVDIINNSSTPSISNISDLTKAGYVYSFGIELNMATSGTDNPLILIKNPSGSGKTLYIYKIQFGVTVQNQAAKYILWANPTITTNGTSQTPINRVIGGGFGASAITLFTFPTISANGSTIMNLGVGQNTNSLESIQDFSVQVAPNNNLLITGSPTSNNRTASITVVWAEY